MLAGEGQHPLDDHVVERHRLHQGLQVLGLSGQAVDALAEHLVEQLAELWFRCSLVSARRSCEVIGVEDSDLVVEAVEERHVARLVGDLRAEEDAHLLVGGGAHHRPELGGHSLLADEERRQPVHALEALLGGDALVPVDPVLGEVDVLDRPLLALPQAVELAVGEEVGLSPVGGLDEGRVARGLEVRALGALAVASVTALSSGCPAGSRLPDEPRAGWLAGQARLGRLRAGLGGGLDHHDACHRPIEAQALGPGPQAVERRRAASRCAAPSCPRRRAVRAPVRRAQLRPHREERGHPHQSRRDLPAAAGEHRGRAGRLPRRLPRRAGTRDPHAGARRLRRRVLGRVRLVGEVSAGAVSVRCRGAVAVSVPDDS